MYSMEYDTKDTLISEVYVARLGRDTYDVNLVQDRVCDHVCNRSM